ncbi:MAG TPA: hypothetical protein VL069_09885, partial [Opitutus sp.]|nr:hypothetical protein [Opitutus sp.]
MTKFPPLNSDATSVPAGWQSRPMVQCITRLTAFFAFNRELLRTEAAWFAGVPYWDAKLTLAKHLLEDAQHAEALLKRLHELKATSAEHKQVDGLEEFVRDLASARNGDEWLHGLYGCVKPWLIAQLETYLEESDPVMDAPSHDVIERILGDLRRQLNWFLGYTPRFS